MALHLMVTGSRACATWLREPGAFGRRFERLVEELGLPAGWRPSTLIVGDAVGVDRLATAWAREAGLPVTVHVPEWGRYGRGAGLRRNAEMARDATAVVAFWDMESRGTKHAMEAAGAKLWAVVNVGAASGPTTPADVRQRSLV